MTALHKPIGPLIVSLLLVGLSGSRALADTTNYWINPGSGYNGNFTDAAHWSLGLPTTTPTDFIFFSTQQSTPFTVTLTNAVTTGRVGIFNNSVTYNLNGYSWTVNNNYPPTNDGKLGAQINNTTNYTITVKFSSGAAPVSGGNFANLGSSYYTADAYGADRTTRIVVDDSLGYPVKLVIPLGVSQPLFRADVLVNGTNSELDVNYSYNGGVPLVTPNLVVTNRAVFRALVDTMVWGYYSVTPSATGLFYNSTLTTFKGAELGGYYYGAGVINLYDGSTWTDAGNVQLGGLPNSTSPLPFKGNVLLDSSTFAGSNVTVGATTAASPGQFVLQNNSTATISNGLLISAYSLANATNTFSLNNSTLNLGGAVNGWATNYAYVRVNGSTINGRGPGNALFYMGAGTGTNAILDLRGAGHLSRVNLQEQPNTTTYFDFSETALSQVAASNGFVNLLGTNRFSLAVSAPAPVHGVKYGLGVYDFAIATNLTWTPQYDNLVNLLTNTYHLTYGVDFNYGVVNLGGGLFALELAFVPEPSTLLLLALGGLLVFRRIRRARLPQRTAVILLIPAILLLSPGAGQGATDYWTNAVAGGSYQFSTGGNWSLGTPPAGGDSPWFSNQVGSAYTVQFSGSQSNGALYVYNDNVIFNLNGRAWTNAGTSAIGSNSPSATSVRFSSSTPAVGSSGNLAYFRGTSTGVFYGTNTTVLVDDSLGYPATLVIGPVAANGTGMGSGMKFVVSGTNAELRMTSNYFSTEGQIVVSNGAVLNNTASGGASFGYYGNNASACSVSVNNASVNTPSGAYVGAYGDRGVVIMTNGIWNAGPFIFLGTDGLGVSAPNPYKGVVLVSSSTVNTTSATIGGWDGNGAAPGLMQILNGSSVTVSNQAVIPPFYRFSATNMLVLKDSLLYLGNGTTPGAITNYGIIRASGTITGRGTIGNYSLYSGYLITNVTVSLAYTNAGQLDVGRNVAGSSDSLGTLTMNHGDLTMDANTKTYLEFGNTGLDQIVATNGFVRLLGSNVFALASGAPAPTNGVKYGLGIYKFVIATNSNISAPQYDNLVTLLTNTYHLTYGVDFHYGVADLGSGLFALELVFVPEPSTVLLLALGGLLVWYRRGRKTLGLLALVGALALGFSGSARGDTTNYWQSDAGNYNGNFANINHWTLGTVPTNPVVTRAPGATTPVEFLFFASSQSTPYTVQFTNSMTTGRVGIFGDSVTFDLNGHQWITQNKYGVAGYPNVYDSMLGFQIAATNAYPQTIHFSSSAPPVNGTNLADFGQSYYTIDGLGTNRNTRIIVDDSLGYPVQVIMPVNHVASFLSDVLVSGTNAELDIVYTYVGGFPVAAPNLVVTNRAVARFLTDAFFFGSYQTYIAATGLVYNSALYSPKGTRMGGPAPGSGVLRLYDGSTWTDGGNAQIGEGASGPLPYRGDVLLDNSTFIGSNLLVGAAAVTGPGRFVAQNNSTVTVSNGLLISARSASNATNFFSLQNSTLNLGGSVNGWATNFAYVRVNGGTISGVGPGNALFYMGASAGTNAILDLRGAGHLSRVNLQEQPNTTTYFDFSDTALSQVTASNGFVNLLGTNRFSLAAGAPAPTNGVKYGLGIYNFVIGTNVNNSPQYDNLVNLLTNTYHLTYGVDFTYGLADLGGGLFALQLAFVPEPSTVLLLALGGLLVWYRRSRKTLGLLALVGLLAVGISGSVRADTTNYWQSVAGNYSGNYTNAAQWTGIVPASTTDGAWFSNRQSSAYTVTFTKSVTNGPMNVYDDNVVFNLNGYNWQNAGSGSIGSNSSYATSVRFSSSSTPLVSGGNVVKYGQASWAYLQDFTGPNTTIFVDDSLGQPVRLVFDGANPARGFGYGANAVVSGSGSEMYWGNVYSAGNYGYNLLVTNGALFTDTHYMYMGYYAFGAAGETIKVVNASMKTVGTTIGYDYGARELVSLSDHSTWTESGALITVGDVYPAYLQADKYAGRLLIDQSTLNAQAMLVGGVTWSNGNVNSAGWVKLLNGSTMTLSNGYLFISAQEDGPTNSFFTMKNSTLNLGRAGVNGAVTNRSWLTAQGTITGQGAGNFLLRNEGSFTVGGSPGVLTLNKGNVELAAGSRNYFQFSDTALSQIVASNGYASLLGSNIFSLAAGAPAPTNGVKYGLGIYNFVIGTNVTNSSQYDNLVNLLTNTYHLTYGVDFQYGVADLGGGLFALQLAFVPEPSTVLLLALGGLLVWFRRGRKTLGLLALVSLVALGSAGSARADTTNYWTNPGTGYSGNYTNAAQWTGIVPSATTDFAWFNNHQTTPYTVQFTSSPTNGPLFVYDDKVTFDLNGYNWQTANAGQIGSNSAYATTVRFSSGSAPKVSGGNVVQFGTGWANSEAIYGANTTIIVDDSLGQPVKLIYAGGAPAAGPGYGANLVVSGNGSEMVWDYVYSPAYYGFNLTVTNGAKFSEIGGWRFGVGTYGSGAATTVLVANASVRTTAGTDIGGAYGGPAVMILSNHSTWTESGSTQVGYSFYLDAGYYCGRLLMDNSTLDGQSMVLGGFHALYNGPGQVQVLNGSSMTLSNGYLLVTDLNYGMATNTFVLKGSNLYLGQLGINGAITNRGILQAQGTITGHGSGNFLLRNEQKMIVGGSPGVLTLNKGNVELAAGSKNYFQFSDTALSQINAHNGYASLLGSNIFALAAGAPAPVPGVKYGLGIYNFVIGTNVNNSSQYDNLVNLLTNTYHLTYGVDFQYGVADLGGGLFALQLAFVPEPSTVLLLALGGLLVWYRRGRKTLGLLALVCLLALSLSGSARADTTNYWQTSGGNYNGTMNGTANWSLGTTPGSTTQVFFTNHQAAVSAYTNQLSGSITTGPVRVYDDSLVYDLNGYRWTVNETGAGSYLGTNGGAAMTVKFSSSSPINVANGNVADIGGSTGVESSFAPNTTVIVDDSLGKPVTLVWRSYLSPVYGNLIVSGTGSVFEVNYPSTWGGFGGASKTLVTNGAVLTADWGPSGGKLKIGALSYLTPATCTVVGATIKAPYGTQIGFYYSSGVVDVRAGSTWYDGDTVEVGDYVAYWGKASLDNSTLYGQKLIVGDETSGYANYYGTYGQFAILNGASATFSNSVTVAASPTSVAVTNLLLLNNATIRLGGGALNGTITNRGTIRAQGTITGLGAGNFLLRNEGRLEVGSSPGVLTLNKGNVQLAAGSVNYFQFSDTALSQINAQNGYASLLGSNIFSLAAGAPAPTNGVKYGLGLYNFVIATNITKATQYDNLVNLLTNTYKLTYGVDFHYGVVDLGGGLFALQLAFVPEPSTVLLLALGGLLVWRRMAKRGGRQ